MELEESALRSWQLLAQFRKRLKPHLEAAPKTPTQEDPRRELLAEDYFCLLLFGLFNPALKSMRALCHASGRFEKMRQICSRPVAPASFSEAQHVFDPEMLAAVLRQLAHRFIPRSSILNHQSSIPHLLHSMFGVRSSKFSPPRPLPVPPNAHFSFLTFQLISFSCNPDGGISICNRHGRFVNCQFWF